MPQPKKTRRALALIAAALVAVALVVVGLNSLSTERPVLRPDVDGDAAAAAVGGDGGPTSGEPPVLPPHTSRVATVRDTSKPVVVFASPSGLDQLDPLPATGDYGQPQVFLVTDQVGGRLEVLLPIRPNGSQGWIAADTVDVTTHDYEIEVSLSQFQMTVLKGGEPIIETPVGVGKSDTPTVGGGYYTWVLIDPTNAGYGSYAYGLSGFSTLPEFNGGDGRMGIHGDTDPSSFGREVSHGCVRVPDEVMVQMAEELQLPLGVPVTILA